MLAFLCKMARFLFNCKVAWWKATVPTAIQFGGTKYIELDPDPEFWPNCGSGSGILAQLWIRIQNFGTITDPDHFWFILSKKLYFSIFSYRVIGTYYIHILVKKILQKVVKHMYCRWENRLYHTHFLQNDDVQMTCTVQYCTVLEG